MRINVFRQAMIGFHAESYSVETFANVQKPFEESSNEFRRLR
jgi:hypothetical protein